MAPSTKDNVLILGATGYIGVYIVEEIIKAKDSFGRIAIFTSPNSAEKKSKQLDELKAQGVEVIVGDVNNSEDLLKAFEGINTVISAVGRNAIAQQIEWVKLAVQAPTVKRFFPSEFGTDIEYGPESVNEVPHQQKLKVRTALKEASQSGLEYTYVVTGPFAGGYLSAGWVPEIGSFDVKAKKAVVLGDGKGKISLTTTPDVGKLTVKALLHPEASRNRALRVNSFTATLLDIVAEFEKQTGGDKWSVSYTPLEKVRELEKQAYADGHPGAVGFTLKRIWGEGGTLYEKRDNGLIDGEDTDTLEDAVKVAIAAQTEPKEQL
ncbi:hypothetical protein EG329_002235 [Mollisiaceae sp. DMI_Dod_QoI]|nr:hypothetical protein EG329_002235 [Helotiales sp. DMI_Dod_QoI]